MTVTCTYDHRVIQGAESGLFLAQMQALLEGEDSFYDQIYRDLGIPSQAGRWEVEKAAAPMVSPIRSSKRRVARLIQAWRERGHLVADIDPLGVPRPPHPDLEPSAHGLTIWDLDRTLSRRIVRRADAARLARPAARDLRRQDGRAVHAHRESGRAAMDSWNTGAAPTGLSMPKRKRRAF